MRLFKLAQVLKTGDVSQLRNLFVDLAQLRDKQINLVLDKGFCSEHNFLMMFRNHVGFIAGLRSDLAIAAQTADELMPSLRLDRKSVV